MAPQKCGRIVPEAVSQTRTVVMRETSRLGGGARPPGRRGLLALLQWPGVPRLGARQGFARCAFEAFGCEVTQDGDDEGIVFLDWLPTAEEAEVIRDKLRIPKNRAMGEAELERLRALSAKHGFVRREHIVADEISAE